MDFDKLIIIGGGIMDMLTALRLCDLFNDIVIYEKRTSRDRKNIIMLNKYSIDNIPFEFMENINPPNLYQFVNYATENNYIKAISIDHFEHNLLKLIDQKNIIKIIHKELRENDIVDIINSSKNAFIIAADGSNSITRNIIGSNIIEYLTSYGLVMHFKKIEGEHNIEHIKKKYNVNVKKIMHVEQNRFRCFILNNGSCQLSIQLTKNEYDNLDHIIDDLLASCAKFYGIELPSKIITNHFPIKIFKSQNFIKKIKSNIVILVGDSLCGVNFFGSSGVDIGIKVLDKIYDLCYKLVKFKDKYSITNLIKSFIKSIELITSINLSNEPNIFIDKNQIESIQKKYSNKQLDMFANFNNIYTNSLSKYEKCFVLSKLFLTFEPNKIYNKIAKKVKKKYNIDKYKQIMIYS